MCLKYFLFDGEIFEVFVIQGSIYKDEEKIIEQKIVFYLEKSIKMNRNRFIEYKLLRSYMRVLRRKYQILLY